MLCALLAYSDHGTGTRIGRKNPQTYTNLRCQQLTGVRSRVRDKAGWLWTIHSTMPEVKRLANCFVILLVIEAVLYLYFKYRYGLDIFSR